MKKATLLAGIALACASTVAFAAKPALTHQQKKELAAQAKKKLPEVEATQPRTQDQARATKTTNRLGTQVRVPTELWNTLAVTNEDGTLRVVDTDGITAPATEGLPHE